MYLKTVEIYGFKSFTNKVKLSFKPGITCVVGPNGCGKSNVVDSIRWCLGEMSWKSLRLPTMMDVIFAGTAKRPALNMAEVSLTFDNESRKLPLDFGEVTVTRKIYRSDESEYFINKVPCRLKDIRELFLDTGIGSNGYAIIDQGEVEFVLSTTPEERREIFEEAAGVSKYKAKRDEAQKKLEKVDSDLGRLADSIVLIGDQLKKLDAEAKKARLQQKYKEELRNSEIAFILKEIASFKKEIEDKNSVLSPLIQEMSDLSASITSLEGEMAALSLNLTQKQDDERSLSSEISSIRIEISQLEERINKDDIIQKDISKQLLDIDEQEKRNLQNLDAISPQIEQAQVRFKEAQSVLLNSKNELEKSNSLMKNAEQEIFDLSTKIRELDQNLSNLYTTDVEISKKIAWEESTITHKKTEMTSLQKEVEQFNKKIEESRTKGHELKNALAQKKSLIDSLSQKLSELENLQKMQDSKINEIDSKLSEINSKKTWNTSRLETLTLQTEKNSHTLGINSVINAGMNGVKGTLRHLITVRKEDRVLVEEALGEFLDSVVVDTLEHAQEAINYLKHLGKGRCKFLILENVKNTATIQWRVPNAVELKEKITYPPDFEPLISHLLNSVYTSGNSVMGPFWICGGADDFASADLFWSEQGELKEKIDLLDDEINKLSLEKTAFISKKEETAAVLKELTENLHNIRIEEQKITSEISNIDSTIKIHEDTIALDAAEIRKIETEITERQKSLSELSSGINEIRTQIDEKKQELSRLAEKRTSCLGEYSKLKEEMAVRRTNFENIEKTIHSIYDEILKLETSQKELLEEKQRLSSRKQELLIRLERTKQELEESMQRLPDVRKELASKETLENQISEEIQELKNNYEKLSINLKDCKDSYSDLEKRKIELQMEVAKTSTRIEDLTTRLIDDWNITLQEAESKYTDMEVDVERVSYLRKRLENMGAVNAMAPEEYENLLTRYNFLNSQVEDLNKAKTDLKSAISKINETTRENFKNTFEKVRTHFKQIYNILFSGGEADIILTQPDNLLETGIEIMAHPPGKKLVSISQLSGGEKALTALALLFSFFCVNPSPFCIMDEADAALDDVNIDRFTRLIKEFSKNTQFILITHNKKTIECADLLYGVTMEELGVSKVISVDFKKASAMADSSTSVSENKNKVESLESRV